jgi:glucokinase
MNDGAILVGDAGGTNVRFALAHLEADRVRLSDIWKRPGADYATFDAAIDAYLATSRPKLAGASFGLAGAVTDGRVQLLHRNWLVERDALKAKLGVARVIVVNDFFAMARSTPELSGDELHEISPGKADRQGSLAVGGPGTGFGMAMVRRLLDETPPITDGWVVIGGEGGHQAFAPQTELEWKLATRLRETQGYVSNELVASGSGFEQSLDALAHAMGVKPPKLSQAEVIEQAKAGDRLALEFCRIRAATVMTAMGNMALASNATGGVFIAGGVSMRLEPWLKEKAAVDRFYSRGPRTALMKPIPIRLIASETAPLTGSAKLWLDEQARGWL